MKNSEFLRLYQQLQKGITFDEIIDLSFATVGYSQTNTDTFWNNALVTDMVTPIQLAQIEQTLRAKDRKPSIYFESSNTPLKTLLENQGYEKDYEDDWLFWSDATIDTEKFGMVRKVESEEDLAMYVDTFNQCYQDDDPQNPYGSQESYLPLIETAWRSFHNTKIEYFTIFNQNKPVGVGALTSEDGIGYIANVGSVKEVRGKGFGKAITLYCVDQSIKHGNKVHALATEEGHYPNDFYQRIGFVPQFSAVSYIKR